MPGFHQNPFIWRAILVIGLVFLTANANAADSCPPNPPMPKLSLPHLRAALARGEQAVIVALGSSSTEGVMASNPGHSYPADLQSALSSALPNRHVAVLNRGIGGQDAARESDRLDRDVLAVQPQLVIWQVGANAALRHADPAAFRRLVGEGVRRLQAAGIDVVLMDNQRSPRVLASNNSEEFDQVLQDVSRSTGAGLFSRDHLMLSWEQGGAVAANFIASDELHHNDRGYLCVAKALAEAILAAAAPAELSAAR
jgi:lysophospholipase L1-like esterase